jgi:hypothetical protein
LNELRNTRLWTLYVPDDAFIDVTGVGRFPKTATAPAFAMNIQEMDERVLIVLAGSDFMIACDEDHIPILRRHYCCDLDDIHGRTVEVYHTFAIFGQVHSYPNISMSMILEICGFRLINKVIGKKV